MAEKFTKVVADCTTGESLEVPLTQEEIDVVLKNRADAEEMLSKIALEKEEKEQMRSATIAKLAELGLSQEEINSIIN